MRAAIWKLFKSSKRKWANRVSQLHNRFRVRLTFVSLQVESILSTTFCPIDNKLWLSLHNYVASFLSNSEPERNKTTPHNTHSSNQTRT